MNLWVVVLSDGYSDRAMRVADIMVLLDEEESKKTDHESSK